MEKMKNKKLVIVFFVLFYFVAFFTRLYWISQKEGFNFDEFSTVVLACYNEYVWEKNYELNKFFSGKEIKEMTLCDDGTLKGAITDVLYLYKYNRDTPHTNLYYSLLRISFLGLETGDMQQIFFRGAILNLIFFSISFVFFFLLVRLIFEDDFISLVAVFCTFMSIAAISNTLFMRPYQLQETFFIVFAYFVLKHINKSKIIQTEDKSFIHINFKLLLSTSIITAFTLLTGYYTIIYIFLFGLFIIWYNKIENNFDKEKLKQEFIFYGIALLLAFLIAQFLYTRYVLGYISYRSTGTFRTVLLDKGFLGNCYISIIAALKIFYKHYFVDYVLVAIISLSVYLFAVKNKLDVRVKHIGLFFIAVAFTFLIMYVAPFKMLRYVMPVFPFLTMLPIVLLRSIKKNNHKMFFAILLIIAFEISAYNEENIAHLYKNKIAEYKFTEEIELPVLMAVEEKEYWGYGDIVPFLNDEQKYIFAENIEDIDINISLLKDFEEFFVVIHHHAISEVDIDMSRFKILSEYYISYNVDVGKYFIKCFKLKRLE